MAGRLLRKWEAMGSWTEDPGKQLKGGMPPHQWRAFHVRPPSPTALGLSPPASPPRPPVSCSGSSLSGSARPPPPQSEEVTHTQRSHVVLAGYPWAASLQRPWHPWLSGRPWRPRGHPGPRVLWRLRWPLWSQCSGRLLGPGRPQRAIQPGGQPSGKVTINPDACPLPPLKPTLLVPPPCPS